MALTSNEKSLCNKLLSDFNSLVAPGISVTDAVSDAATSMVNKLTGLIYSNINDLEDALSDYTDDIAGNLPDASLSGLEKIRDFLNNCDYLSSLSPVSAMLGSILGVFEQIDSYIDFYDITFPEFSIGGLASYIDKLLDGVGMPGGDNISALLALADSLLECLSSACATFDPSYVGDLSTMTSDLQDVYDNLNIIDDPLDINYGKYDYDTLYAIAGMTPTEILTINNVVTNLNVSKDAGVEAVDNVVSAIQTATKVGELF